MVHQNFEASILNTLKTLVGDRLLVLTWSVLSEVFFFFIVLAVHNSTGLTFVNAHVHIKRKLKHVKPCARMLANLIRSISLALFIRNS